MTTAPTGNPFVDIDPEGHTAPDVIREWQDIIRYEYPRDEYERGVQETGDRLAAELTRTRAMVAALEQENHALRGLVDSRRARINPDGGFYGSPDWLADADRVLLGDEDGE